MSGFLLEIITPERIAFSEKVEMLTAPASEGEVGILPHHEAYFTLLKEGELKILNNNEEIFLSIGGGFLEVTALKTTVLVSKAVNAEEINEEEVKKAREAAERAIKEGVKGEDLLTAQRLLRSSLIDYKVLQRRRARTKSRTI
ncbi:ATP synthase F1 subunit epsilon [Candidatus Microgenomates bacterium]|nr:ATP synthase F1 subunit epsilon [Candidatus Microgenomates bacterium]